MRGLNGAIIDVEHGSNRGLIRSKQPYISDISVLYVPCIAGGLGNRRMLLGQPSWAESCLEKGKAMPTFHHSDLEKEPFAGYWQPRCSNSSPERRHKLCSCLVTMAHSIAGLTKRWIFWGTGFKGGTKWLIHREFQSGPRHAHACCTLVCACMRKYVYTCIYLYRYGSFINLFIHVIPFHFIALHFTSCHFMSCHVMSLIH